MTEVLQREAGYFVHFI